MGVADIGDNQDNNRDRGKANQALLGIGEARRTGIDPSQALAGSGRNLRSGRSASASTDSNAPMAVVPVLIGSPQKQTFIELAS